MGLSAADDAVPREFGWLLLRLKSRRSSLSPTGRLSATQAPFYVRIKGVAKGEINPAAPENHVITDLDKAPRNAHGMVEYGTDFFILRPVDPRRASGVLVYDVTNRGRKMILSLLDDASGNADTNNPKTPQDIGLGFTLGRGYSLVWSGWDSASTTRQQRNDGAAAASTRKRRADGAPHP